MRADELEKVMKTFAEDAGLAAREHALLSSLERMDRVMLASTGSPDMVDRVLSEMLRIFACDRAFLLYPCDPKAPYFEVVYEQTVPEYPGAKGQRVPMHPLVAADFALALANPGAILRHDPEHNPVPPGDSPFSAFGVRSMLLTACRPKENLPWMLGIQHCREPKVYALELDLLRAVAARLGDAITSMIAQQALRESEERFRALVEHAPDAMVILDVGTGRFIEVNHKATELFGYSREQLLERGPVDVSPPLQPDGLDSREKVKTFLAATLSGQTPSFEWHHRDAKGELLECEVRLLRLPHAQQQWIRGSILHIADRKRAERENERLSAQLAHAQKVQALGQLTGGVAHDFNNLLTVIRGSLDVIEADAGDPAKVRQFGRLALSACDRAAQLIQRLLAFSRQQPLRPRSFALSDLMQGMEGLLERTLGETIRIELRIAEDLWPCEVDPVQLENAILNLCINARDAMPRGGVLILEASNITLDEIATASEDDARPGDYVLLTVSDDGEGMSPDVVAKAFDPFFTTKEVGKGSGLGLSMVYGFIKQSRGQVKIYSEVGLGTTVKLFLPRSARPPGAVERAEPLALERVGQGERILIVEDDDKLRRLIAELVTRLGFSALAARDGKEALELLRSAPDVALLLSDMVLPGGMNGVEVARCAHLLCPHLPVIFMSGYTENAVIHHGKLDEGVRLLEKPFTSAALGRVLREALLEARVRQRA